MKFLLSAIVLLTVLYSNVEAVSEKVHCHVPPVSVPKKWITQVQSCISKIENQINEELTASMTYLAMGAHFARDTINRPGFANFFFESANEEREHAIKLMGYLTMRGKVTGEMKSLIKNPTPKKTEWVSAKAALSYALNLEADVTKSIRDIIVECEQAKDSKGEEANDYHVVDYLTGEFLDEQYKGQRHLAGMISTLGKMIDHNGALGEFLFDKKLLNGEI